MNDVMYALELKHIDELDIMKGVGIMLIVLGHLEPGTYLMRFIYSFHLFVFFTCSGFVGVRYEKRDFREIVKSNIKRLLLPYLVWIVISQVLDLAVGAVDISQAFRNIMFLDASVGWNAALWFLVALFWTDMLCALIVKCKKTIQFSAAIAFVVLWFFIVREQLDLPLGLYTVPVAAFFWLVGYWINICKGYKNMKNVSSKVLVFFGGILLIVNIFCGTVCNSVISIYHIIYQDIRLTILAGIVGVLFIMVFSIVINRKNGRVARVLKFYGSNTLTILCTHYFILRIIGFISQQIVGCNLWRYTSTLKGIIFAIVVVASYYPVLSVTSKMKIKWTVLRYVV